METSDKKNEKLIRYLKGEIDVTPGEDVLADGLAEWKKSIINKEVSQERKDQAWKQINRVTEGKENSSANIRDFKPSQSKTSRSTQIWYAIAASVLILFSGFWLLNQSNSKTETFLSNASSQEIELEDGSIVKLRPYSQLTKHTHSTDEAIYELDGEAFFEVTHNPERPFIVLTNKAKVEVLGTSFMFKNWGDESEVFLKTGKVRFTNLDSQITVDIIPGSSAKIMNNGDIKISEQVEEKLYLDWTQNLLYFDNHLIVPVIAEYEQHFGIEIAPYPWSDEQRVSGSIVIQDARQSLDYLGLILGGVFEETADKVFEFKLND